MFKRILVAVDGSDASQKAVDWAIKTHRELPEAEITICYVHQPQVTVIPGGGVYIPVAYETTGTEVPEHTPASEAYNKFPDKQRVNQVTKVGYPAEEVCRMAEQEHYDVIVLGAEGHGLVSSVLLGSVSAKVLHQAKSAVLIIR
ncbi:universal stress protein [Brevibacillus ginsengisoli]|uniref:universal stress protein n=1 Tax=Brevibacillus ginsengisoli TaxID=363854 RepID=UPI003CF3899A